MSANEETQTGCCGESEEVRRVFAALPFEQRLSTLFCVQLDLVADAIEGAAAATSRALDELTKAFTPSPGQAEATTTPPSGADQTTA